MSGKITYIKGDLLDSQDGVIVHCCNAHGVMGSGVARALRSEWPMVFEPYVNHLMRYKIRDVDPLGTYVTVQVTETLKVVNLIGQRDYGGTSRQVSYDALDVGFSRIFEEFDGSVIHIPLIGAGLANGDWRVIEAIIEGRMKDTTTVICHII